MRNKNSFLKDFLDMLFRLLVMMACSTVVVMFLYGLFTLIFNYLGELGGIIALFVLVFGGLTIGATYMMRKEEREDDNI